jgi:hypothetical protein
MTTAIAIEGGDEPHAAAISAPPGVNVRAAVMAASRRTCQISIQSKNATHQL